jgi:hypothetical protein
MRDVGCRWEYAGWALQPALSKWARLWSDVAGGEGNPVGWRGSPPHLASLDAIRAVR